MGVYKKGVKQTTLGGPDHVPSNALPNGLAMSRMKTDDWPGEAKSVLMKAVSDTKG